MGTQLGNVTKNYGRQHNVTVTNLNGETILSSENLLANTTIISAPTSVSKEDIGTYAIFETDAEGNPVRLSYTIQPGNGLIVGRNGKSETSGDGIDVLSMAIDNFSIKEYPAGARTDVNQGLYVNKENIIDNKTLQVVMTSDTVADRIKVITDNLDHATSLSYGIAKGDESTIMTDDGILTVNTKNLDYVDDDDDINGIIAANQNNSRTIIANNGLLSVWTQNLDPAAEDSLGVIKPDMSYTFVDEDGTLRVKDFVHAYSYVATQPIWDEESEAYVDVQYKKDLYGIVVPDLTTTYTPEAGTLSVRTEGLTPATTDKAGVVKIDGVSTIMNENGVLSVASWGEIQHMLDEFDKRWTDTLAKLADLEGRVATLETIASAEHIILDVDSEMLTTLQLPVWNEAAGAVVSDEENISVELRVSTNCPFKITVEYTDNTNPPIVLNEIKYGSDQVVTAAGLIDKQFDSTDDTINQLKLSFVCKNYTSDTDESIIQTVATIKVTSINDAAVCKKAVHTFVRHNCAKYVKVEPEDTETVSPTKAPLGTKFVKFTELSSTMGGYTTESDYNTKATFEYPLYIGALYHSAYYDANNVRRDFDINGYAKPVLSTYQGKNNIKVSAVDADTNEEVTWLRYALASSYVTSDTHTNYIKVTTDKATVTRSAKITFSYANGTTVYDTPDPVSMYFTQYVPAQQPTIKCIASNVVTTSSENIDIYNTTLTVSRDTVSGLYKPTNGWNVFVSTYEVSFNGTQLTEPVWHKLHGTNSTYQVSTSWQSPAANDAIATHIGGAYVTAYTFLYDGDPNFVFYNRGMWAHMISFGDASYTMGDAQISNVNIVSWDDVSMDVVFTITPGADTYLPIGGTLKFVNDTTADGKFAMKIVNDSNITYDITKFYDYMKVTSSKWTSSGCTVTFTFYNEESGDVHTYHKHSTTTKQPYIGCIGEFSHTYDDSLSLYVTASNNANTPVLSNFIFLKFWFKLSALNEDGNMIGCNFEVNNTGSLYKFGNTRKTITCLTGYTENVTIINGLYDVTSTSTSN